MRAPTLLALVAALGACGGSEPESDWEELAPLGHGRSAHAVVADGEAVYAVGGTGAGGEPVLAVERFDGARWVEETTLPGEGLNAPAATLLDGRLYVLGGFGTTTNVPTAEVRVYELESRRWSTAAPLPAARGGHAAVVLDGRIHVLGGGDASATLALHSVYDPARNAWIEAAPLPRAKGSPAAVVHQGRIWAIGGRSGADDFGEVDLYDAQLDTWTTGPPIPPRGTAGAAVHEGTIFVFGGESQAEDRVLGDVLRLDPAGQRWEQVSQLPTPRAYARAVEWEDGVLVVGGSTEPGSSHASPGSTAVEHYVGTE